MDPPPLLDSPWLLPGRPLIVPLTPTPKELTRGAVEVTKRPDTGWPQSARLVRLETEDQPIDAGSPQGRLAAAARRWLDRPVAAVSTWRSVKPDERSNSAPGFWAAVLDVPEALRAGMFDVSLGDRRLRLRCAPSSATKLPGIMEHGARVSEFSQACGKELARLPWEAWRADLLRVQVEGDQSDRLLDIASDQIHVRIARLVERVAAIDPALAQRLILALSPILAFDGGPAVPLPVDDSSIAALARLGEDLDLSTARLIESVRAFADERRAVGAWIVNDAPGENPASASPRVDVAVLNAAPEPAAFSIDAVGMSAPEIVLAKPFTVVRAAASMAPPAPAEPEMLASTGVQLPPRTSQAQRAATVDLRIRVGGSERSRIAVPRAVPVRPPGADLAPLAPDWSAESLLASARSESATPPIPLVNGALTARARLYAELDNGRLAWRLYIECESRGEVGDERVEVHFGPGSRPIGAWALDVQGRVRSVGPGLRPSPAQSRVEVIRTDRSWSAIMPVPTGAIETSAGGDGRPVQSVRIGMVRMSSDGTRSAWPRPMLPWQTDVPRALFDLSSWSDSGPP